MNKADEVGWVDTSDAKDSEQGISHISDEERLELVEASEHHEIVKELGTIQAKLTATQDEPKLPATRATAAPTPAPTYAPAIKTIVPAPTTDDGEDHTGERIPSPIPPGQIDPVALKLLAKGVELGASDVHLASGSSPFFRLNGQIVFTELKPLTAEQAMHMVLGFMDDTQQQHFLHTHDIDFSLDYENLARFRVNALLQFRGPSIIFRIIPRKIPTLKDLGLPESLGRFTEYHQGLVLVTGPAGCGKTTTAAALIDLVNSHRKDHIITVEDPVEFLQISKGCNVTQRQVPIHTKSFSTALKAALREDPDVIMIGEMRDLETVSLAIRAAETGHLVIGTLQTKSAARTIDRVIDVFPEDQQAQIRAMLSESLRGIITQQLIPRKDGKGRVVSLEVLNVISSVSNLIRDAKTYQLPSQMQTGRKQGQVMMDDSLNDLIQKNLITKEEAAKVSENPKKFR
ncbi:MAG: PilT/PilU family type 4a pilus ATPase [Phycisphaeraceae bacterium]|nr:PilT/PilU family type 4a pilus ATPase [Phycisphaeraceae bacterium]